jgi:hypothetical protein
MSRFNDTFDDLDVATVCRVAARQDEVRPHTKMDFEQKGPTTDPIGQLYRAIKER